MHKPGTAQQKNVAAGQSGLLAPDTSGMNFYRADPALTDLIDSIGPSKVAIP